jgi:uncharacterized repeat protein (TIGR03803 family)
MDRPCELTIVTGTGSLNDNAAIGTIIQTTARGARGSYKDSAAAVLRIFVVIDDNGIGSGIRSQARSRAGNNNRVYRLKSGRRRGRREYRYNKRCRDNGRRKSGFHVPPQPVQGTTSTKSASRADGWNCLWTKIGVCLEPLQRRLPMRRLLLALISLALFACNAAVAAKLNIVESFCGLKDCRYAGTPSGLARDSAGNLYGVTGGSRGNLGKVIYELANGKDYKLLYVLCPRRECPSGDDPSGPLVVDVAGNLYGTMSSGGSQNLGTVFELSPDAERKHWSA